VGAALEGLGLPQGRPVMAHVRLKPLHEATGLGYAALARELLDLLHGVLAPATVLVPTFTYSFSKSGVFHRLFSRAETGRFSEEARRLGLARTPDPMFSVLDSRGWLAGRPVDHGTAFGPGSLWELLDREDAVVLNLGIEAMVATQVHFVEECMRVPYRMDTVMPGVAYLDEGSWAPVNYRFFARDLARNRLLDWPGIEARLARYGAWRTDEATGVKLGWTTCRILREALEPAVHENPYVLVSGRTDGR
jgi:aminoglycoside N3'-acetyltransferase